MRSRGFTLVGKGQGERQAITGGMERRAQQRVDLRRGARERKYFFWGGKRGDAGPTLANRGERGLSQSVEEVAMRSQCRGKLVEADAPSS